MKRCAIVGAGFAGLSAAIELARGGCEVDVFERGDRPGGLAAQITTPEGFRFDCGPTIIVMTDVLARALGPQEFAKLHLQKLQPGYRVLWPDGAQFEMHSDIALLLEQAARFEPTCSAAMLGYLADVHEQFVASRATILDVDHTPASLLQLLLRPGRLRPWVLRGLRAFTEGRFHHERLVQALTFQSLYLGTSPLRAPAMYALLPVEEIVGGVWFSPGGTGSIVRAFERAAQAHGVRFHYNVDVQSIEQAGNRATHVTTSQGSLPYEGVVITAGRDGAMQRFFNAAPSRARYGHSALVFYLGINRAVNLGHHTVMLPADPWRSYAQLDAGVLPDEPMLYVANPSATDASFAPQNAASVMVLAPVPNLRKLPQFDVQAVFDRALARIEQHAGSLREHIMHRSVRGPHEFAALGLVAGAAFGPDHTLDQMGPLRAPIAHPRLSNVVFAGSGTRPGSGIPMVVMSGRLAALRLLAR